MTLRRGLLIILSSPSGAGKSTLAGKLRAWDDSIRFSISATTRAARPGEVDGREYHFVSEPKFKQMVAAGDMLEHAHVFGNFYGSPRAPVEEAIHAGQDILFDIDWQGAQQIANSALAPHVLSIFLLPPSMTELRRRLVNRAEDTAEAIELRLAKARNEIVQAKAYDYLVVNDDFDQAELDLRAIIRTHRIAQNPPLDLLHQLLDS